MEMDPPPPPPPAAVLTPKSFVSSVKGKDLRYHVLVTIKRWFQSDTRDKKLEDLLLLPLAQRKPEDNRRFYPCDMEALTQAWNQLANVTEEFMWQTMKRLRYKLKRTGYLRNELDYCFPHPYRNRESGVLSNNFDWMDHESEIEELAGRDKDGYTRVYKPDGRFVLYMDGLEVELAPAEDRKLLGVDYGDESDDSDVSDDPFHGQVPDMWPYSSGVDVPGPLDKDDNE